MRMFKIETFSHDSGELIDSMSVPTALVKSMLTLLPKKFMSKFDENGDQLEVLLSAVLNPDYNGVILDLVDVADNERVVCHCIREAESIRIISARKAGKQERKIYEDYRYA